MAKRKKIKGQGLFLALEGPDSFRFSHAFEYGEGGGWAGLFGGFHAVTFEEFEGEGVIGLGSPRARVIERNGLAVAGGFGEPDIARNRGLEDAVVEEADEVFADLLGEVGAVVEHGEQHAFEGEAGIEAGGYAVEGGHELGDSLEGEVFGLHGDEEGVGGYEGVEGEEVEGGGAIEEDEGIFGANWLECFAEAGFAAFDGDELEVRPDHVAGSGDEGEVCDFRGEDDLAGGGVAEEEVVDGEAGFVAGKAEASGGVGLGIDVEEEYGNAFKGDGGGQIDGRGGFADSALLVDDGDDLAVRGRRSGGGRILGG